MFKENKYSKIYFQIIEQANARSVLSTVVEQHHIIPRSLGGDDNWDNLVKLSPREHYICHALLVKMVKTTNAQYKMRAAFNMMNMNKTNMRYTSRLYEYNKIKFYQQHSEYQKGTIKKQSSRTKQSNTTKGSVWTNKAKHANREYKTNKIKQKEINGTLVNTWDSISSVKQHGYDPTTVQNVCQGLAKSHANYLWEYVEEHPIKNTNLLYQQFDQNGKLTNQFETSKQAAKHTGYHFTSILKACNTGNSLGGYCWHVKKRPIKYKIVQYDKDGTIIDYYVSIRDAARQTKIHKSIISRILSQKQQQYTKTQTTFAYLNNEEINNE